MKNINAIIKSLNSHLPQYALRRNSRYYEYVCYINNIYTLYVCELYEEVELFIDRAYKYLEKNKNAIDIENQYIQESRKLLKYVSENLESNTL